MKLLALIPALFSLLLWSAEARAQCYRMVWADEFDYEGLPNEEKWSYDVGGHGWGNQELQYYTEKDSDNARVADGKLTIEARKESFGNNNYTSARLVSKAKGDWLYGKMVIRAKLPSGRGTWPAIWMLPTDWAYGNWPASGEIDIMEHVGYDMNKVHGTVHTEAYNHQKGTQKGGHTIVESVNTTFHDYAIEWHANKIDFFVDGNKYFTFDRNANHTFATWPFDKRFHFILNIAIGGFWGGAEGIDDTIFPQKMEIDYVRVYQQVSEFEIEGPDYVTPAQIATYKAKGVIDGVFEWTVPAGATIVEGQGTSQVVINWQQAEGNLIAKTVVDCQTLSDTLEVQQVATPTGNGWLIEDFNNGQLLDWDAPKGTPNNFVVAEKNGALRIDFNVTKPSDNPKAVLTFDRSVNLTNHSEMFIRFKTQNKSNSINARVDLMDNKGLQTTATPVFNLNPLIDDGEYYTYRFDFAKWETGTSGVKVDASRIKQLVLFINFGVFGEAASDSVWIDNIEMRTAGGTVPPNRPSHLTAVAQSGGVSLAWLDQSSDETGFVIQRGNTANGTFTTIAENLAANAKTYLDATAEVGKTYFYRAFSKNAAGTSEVSNTVASTGSVTGLEELPANLVNVFPNPTQGELFVTSNLPKSRAAWVYRVYNMQGQLLLEGKHSDSQAISMKSFSNGLYTLVLMSEIGWVKHKILLQQ